MNRLEKIFLVLTCVGAFAAGIVTMLEKWRAIPERIVTQPVYVRVEVTPNERQYCESKFCVYATPDGLRVVNYTLNAIHCDWMPANKEEAGAGPSTTAGGNSWWAIGRPGPFLKCGN